MVIINDNNIPIRASYDRHDRPSLLRMSWLDSSFSIARHALSQAQKSIDRVLDINEGEGDPENGQPTAQSGSSSNKSDGTSIEGGSISKSPFSSWFQSKPAESQSGSKPTTPPGQTLHSSTESDSFSSTWGISDSFWGGYSGSPAKEEKSKSALKQSKKPPTAKGSARTKSSSSATRKAPPTSSPTGNGSGNTTLATPTSRANWGSSPLRLQSPSLTSTPVNETKGREDGVAPRPAKPAEQPDQQDTDGKVSEPSITRVGERATPETVKDKIQHSLDFPDSPVVLDTRKSSTGADVTSRTDKDGLTITSEQDSTTIPREFASGAKTLSGIVSTAVAAERRSNSGSSPVDSQDETERQSVGTLAYVTRASILNPGEKATSSLDSESQATTSELAAAPFTAELGKDTASESGHLPPSLASESGHLPPSLASESGHLPPSLASESEHLPPSLASESGHLPPSLASESEHLPPSLASESGHLPPSLASESEHLPPSLQLLTGGDSESDSKGHFELKMAEIPAERKKDSSHGDREHATASKQETERTSVSPHPSQTAGSGQLKVDELTTDEHQPVSRPPELTSPEPCLPSSGGSPTQEKEQPARGSLQRPADTEIQQTRDPSLQSIVGERQKEVERGGEQAAVVVESPLSSQDDVGKLKEELVRVREVLEVRESKMVQMSKESIELVEENQTLHKQLSEAQEALQKADMEELRSEFTKRIGVVEKKLQTVTRERDSLRKQLQAVQNEQTQQKRSAEEDLSEKLREKEEQVAGLMEEGEKLSKQQLQSNNIIKKLRVKEKQNDQLLSAQRQQIEDCENEVRRLKEVMKKKEESEKKYQESLSQLNTIAEQQDKELTALKAERGELTDRVRSLQTNLDSAYKELAGLQKANAASQSVAQEAALSAEQSAREELRSVLEQQRLEALREKDSLLLQLNELRMGVSRAEQQAAWREDHIRQEVADMQQRLQEAEGRNHELTSSISQATKPLLRQIENLQMAHSTQAANWERVEANLTRRLVEAQTQLGVAVERERSAVEKELGLQSRVSSLETTLASLRQERSQLLASLELERAKLETLEEGQQRDSAKMEALRASYQQSMEELKKEKEMLERQLEYERVRLEAESRKACLESQEKERLRSQLASSLSSLNRTVSRQSSTASVQSQSEILEKSLVSEGGGILEGAHHGRTPLASASVMEHLQSLLKQKEGERANAQNLVDSLERSRGAMAEDLASLSAQNEDLAEQLKTVPPLKEKLLEVERNYEALLQMYGEKAEEAEELKLDIHDLKTMYRQQIDELLSGKR